MSTILDQPVYDDSAVNGGHNPHDARPDQNQYYGRPAAVKYWHTAGDSEDIVPARLNKVVSNHYVDWQCEAKGEFDDHSATALSRTGNRNNLFHVQDDSQLPIYANQCADITNIRSKPEFAFKVAESNAVPPALKIICRPYEWIDQVVHIFEYDPENQHLCCEIPGLDMVEKNRHTEDASDGGEYRE